MNLGNDDLMKKLKNLENLKNDLEAKNKRQETQISQFNREKDNL